MRPSIPTLATLTSLALAASAAAEDGWSLIQSIEITEAETADGWFTEKRFPEALIAAADDFTISGYFVPVLPQGEITQFLLVPDPVDCPFCGGGGYGPVLEVHTRRPIRDMPEFTELTVRGTLELIPDSDTYQAVRLVNASHAIAR